MAVMQLNIFVENKKGAVTEITRILKSNDIDMRAMVLADGQDYGVLRLIVSDTDKAMEALCANGIIAKVIKITIVRIKNVQGGLSAVLELLDTNDVNIEYMYAFVVGDGQEAYAAMRFENKDKALKVLEENNIPMLGEAEV